MIFVPSTLSLSTLFSICLSVHLCWFLSHSLSIYLSVALIARFTCVSLLDFSLYLSRHPSHGICFLYVVLFLSVCWPQILLFVYSHLFHTLIFLLLSPFSVCLLACLPVISRSPFHCFHSPSLRFHEDLPTAAVHFLLHFHGRRCFSLGPLPY